MVIVVLSSIVTQGAQITVRTADALPSDAKDSRAVASGAKDIGMKDPKWGVIQHPQVKGVVVASAVAILSTRVPLNHLMK